MRNIFHTKWIFAAGLVMAVVIVATGAFVHKNEANAVGGLAGPSLHGYAWSSNIGWISLHCGEGTTFGTGVGTVCSNVPYNVAFDATTGAFSGYAWSSNVGWVSFNAADVSSCGSAPIMNLSTHLVTGWAKVVSGNAADGADGCINLGNTGHGDGLVYNPASAPVTIGTTTLAGHAITGYVWGDVNVGWISFDHATLTTTSPVVDIKVTLPGGVASDGPVTMATSLGGPVTLSWTSSGITAGSCHGPTTPYYGWTGTKPDNGSEIITVPGNSTSSAISFTYNITCMDSSSYIGDPVPVVIVVPPPTAAELEVAFTVSAGSSGDVTYINVDPGTPVTLKWVTQNTNNLSCIGGSSPTYSAWNGPKSSSSTTTVATATYVTGPMTVDRDFTLSGCTSSLTGTVHSTYTVSVHINPVWCEIVPTTPPFTSGAPGGVMSEKNVAAGTGGAVNDTQYFTVLWHGGMTPDYPVVITTPFIYGTEVTAAFIDTPNITPTHPVGIHTTGTITGTNSVMALAPTTECSGEITHYNMPGAGPGPGPGTGGIRPPWREF